MLLETVLLIIRTSYLPEVDGKQARRARPQPAKDVAGMAATETRIDDMTFELTSATTAQGDTKKTR